MGDHGVIQGLLLDKVAKDLVDKDDFTALCLAIRREHYEIAQTLIEAGADVNLGGGIFGSPLHLAIARLKIHLVQSLVSRGADLSK